MASISVVREPFDAAAEAAALVGGRTDVGALVSFVGLCRDEGGRLAALEIEHYPGMAEAEIARVAAQAQARWPLLGLTIVHRYGLIEPGEPIVLVVTASAHRQAAFEAAEFLMDYLKTQAPFWKKEHLRPGADGREAGRSKDDAGRWVEARAEDDAAAGRWGEERT